MLASIGGGSVKGYQSFMPSGPEGLYMGPWDFEDTTSRTFSGTGAGIEIIGPSAGNQLGNLDDFDLEFEVYSQTNMSSNQWILCNGPYTDPEGFMIGIYDVSPYEGIAVAGGRIGGYGNSPYATIPYNTWTHVQIKCRFSSTVASERKIEIWQDGVLIGTQTGLPSNTLINWDYLYVGQGASGGSKPSPSWSSMGLYGSIRNVKIAKRVPFSTTTFPMGHFDTGYVNYSGGTPWFSANYFGVDIGTEHQLTAGTEIGSKKFKGRAMTSSSHSFWILVYEHTGGTIATANAQFTIQAGWRIDVPNPGSAGANFTTGALDTLSNATGSGYSHPNNFTVPAGKTYYLGWYSGSGGQGYGSPSGALYQGTVAGASDNGGPVSSAYNPNYTPSYISYSGTSSTTAPTLGDVITMNSNNQNTFMQMGLVV
tara:strand:- start:381 stop:1652 length:1272 start_codon:yes stop_codon:yes gene_type:complete